MMGQMQMQRMGQGQGAGAMMNSMMGGMGGRSTTKPERKGTDIRSQNAKADRTKTEKEIEAAKGAALFDPHFDVVEVTVYGKARFFLTPPEEPAAEPSLGDAPAAATPPADAGKTAAPGEKPDASKTDSGADASKAPAGAATDEKPAPKGDVEKSAPKGDVEKPAPKPAAPEGKGAAPKS
jgi:hypothetical protein